MDLVIAVLVTPTIRSFLLIPLLLTCILLFFRSRALWIRFGLAHLGRFSGESVVASLDSSGHLISDLIGDLYSMHALVQA